MSSRDVIDLFKLDARIYPDHVEDASETTDTQKGLIHVKVVKQWYKERILGRGGFGVVWLEKERGGELRAVKEIAKSDMSKTNESESQVDYEELLAMAILSKYKGGAFVKFYGWYETMETIFLAMEYFPYSDLRKYLNVEFPESDAKAITQQLLIGLKIMHENHITHRDLKPENIFVFQKSPKWWVKIGDFGISKRIKSEETALRSYVGTQSFQAPEILGFGVKNQESSEYTDAVDIWSLGCVIYQLLTLKVPFPSYASIALFSQKSTHFPAEALRARHIDETCVSLLENMLIIEPSNRLSAEIALQSPWFSKVSVNGVSTGLNQDPHRVREISPALSGSQGPSPLGKRYATRRSPRFDGSTHNFTIAERTRQAPQVRQYMPSLVPQPVVPLASTLNSGLNSVGEEDARAIHPWMDEAAEATTYQPQNHIERSVIDPRMVGQQAERRDVGPPFNNQHFRSNDIFIMVMGPAGAGKSTFISSCGAKKIEGNFGLKSDTRSMSVSSLSLDGKILHLIDTPSFDETCMFDVDALKQISLWLGVSYKKEKILLTGVIYLQRITDYYVGTKAAKNLQMLKYLCGKDSFASIVLATTMWDKTSTEDGSRREYGLASSPEAFSPLIRKGSIMVRYTNNISSAISVIAMLVNQRKPTLLRIQSEIMNQGLVLNQTEAGRFLCVEMNQQQTLFQRQHQETQQDLEFALSRGDQTLVDKLIERQDRLQQKIDLIQRAQDELKVNLAGLSKEQDARLRYFETTYSNQIAVTADESAQPKQPQYSENLSALDIASANNYGSLKVEKDQMPRPRSVGNLQRVNATNSVEPPPVDLARPDSSSSKIVDANQTSKPSRAAWRLSTDMLGFGLAADMANQYTHRKGKLNPLSRSNSGAKPNAAHIISLISDLQSIGQRTLNQLRERCALPTSMSLKVFQEHRATVEMLQAVTEQLSLLLEVSNSASQDFCQNRIILQDGEFLVKLFKGCIAQVTALEELLNKLLASVDTTFQRALKGVTPAWKEKQISDINGMFISYISQIRIARYKASLKKNTYTSSDSKYETSETVASSSKPSFGVSLNRLFERDGSYVPVVLLQCMAAVECFGLDVERIYAISGKVSNVKTLRSVVDDDATKMDFGEAKNFFHDIKSVAVMLKQFLAELPEPLVTGELHAEFEKAARVTDDVSRLDALHAVINRLPDPNYATIRALMFHLSRVQEKRSVNHMNIGNLAICFGPIVMGMTPTEGYTDVAWHNRILETILANAYAIFDEDAAIDPSRPPS